MVLSRLCFAILSNRTFHVLGVRHMMRMSIPSKHQCLFSKLAARIGAYTYKWSACIHEQISVKQYGSIQ